MSLFYFCFLGGEGLQRGQGCRVWVWGEIKCSTGLCIMGNGREEAEKRSIGHVKAGFSERALLMPPNLQKAWITQCTGARPRSVSGCWCVRCDSVVWLMSSPSIHHGKLLPVASWRAFFHVYPQPPSPIMIPSPLFAVRWFYFTLHNLSRPTKDHSFIFMQIIVSSWSNKHGDNIELQSQ